MSFSIITNRSIVVIVIKVVILTVILVIDSLLFHNRDYQPEVVHGRMHTHDVSFIIM